MSDMSMRRLKDSPKDQDVAALGKIGQTKCDICGGEGATNWLHCDAWTKWMRLGCGTNIMHCGKPDCTAQAHVLKRDVISKNRTEAEETERQMLRNIGPGQLARLRYRWYDSFNCSEEFWDWVEGVVGEERAREILEVPCACCGKTLGMPRYTFQDQNGVRSLKTIEEIELHCYAVMGRDPESEPFKSELGSLKDNVRAGGMRKAEIIFESPIFHYYVQHGWSTERMADQRDHWDEAIKATRGRDCGRQYNYEWAYGRFIYYQPTMTFLGQFMKRGGDWPQVVQTNRKQQEEALAALRDQYGENCHENEEFWPKHREISEQQEWAYYCGEECRKKSCDQHGTLFI